MAYNYGCRNGLTGGLSVDGEYISCEVEAGIGTPVHAAPNGAIYVDHNATLGTSSHFRHLNGSWFAMSDD